MMQPGKRKIVEDIEPNFSQRILFDHEKKLQSNILELLEKKQVQDETVECDYSFRHFPQRIAGNRIRKRRQCVEEKLPLQIKGWIEKARKNQQDGGRNYESKQRFTLLRKIETNNQPRFQQRFQFDPEIQKMKLNGIEVKCRIFTVNTMNAEIKYMLSRMGDIRFTSNKLQEAIDELLEECKKEILLDSSHRNTRGLIINRGATIYVKGHNKNGLGPCSKLPNCDAILKYNKQKYPDYFKNDAEDYDNVCFYSRELVGQQLVPYIDKAPDSSTEKMEKDGDVQHFGDDCDADMQRELRGYDDEGVFIFDNFFFDPNSCKLMGIEKLRVGIEDDTFLEAMDMREPCNALISFNLNYIGVNNSSMNLYLNGSIQKIYCTQINNWRDIQSASEYLEDLVFKNEKLKRFALNKKGIDLAKNEKNILSDYYESYDQITVKRMKKSQAQDQTQQDQTQQDQTQQEETQQDQTQQEETETWSQQQEDITHVKDLDELKHRTEKHHLFKLGPVQGEVGLFDKKGMDENDKDNDQEALYDQGENKEYSESHKQEYQSNIKAVLEVLTM